jgi:hypothetical protein
MEQNYINHIVLVLDASTSMTYHAKEVIKVADSQIQYLAQRSKDLDQETRITVYTFNTGPATCLIYDKDVLRMPSISGLYSTSGMTALVDATLLAIGDLAMTPEKYGEHAFLMYILTDGQENASRNHPSVLQQKIGSLPDHWTVAAFVPDQNGIFEAKKFGFHPENIAIWDATSVKGINEAGETIRKTTETFMQNRKAGIRGTRSLFKLNTVSAGEIAKQLTPVPHVRYILFPVGDTCRIDDFVSMQMARPYQLGEAYYELMKKETIQPQKQIAILSNGQLYTGVNARTMLGLPDYNIDVKPADYTNYTIFVQSTSINRKLVGGTTLLILR